MSDEKIEEYFRERTNLHLSKIDERFELIQTKIDKKLDEFSAKFSKKLDELHEKFGGKIESNTKFRWKLAFAAMGVVSTCTVAGTIIAYVIVYLRFFNN